MAAASMAGMSSVEIEAPAKLNLSLGVVARREDGFHEIDSLMVAVTLSDTLVVRDRQEAAGSQASPFQLRVRFGGRLATAEGAALARDVPDDDRNLAVRAAQALAAAAGLDRGLEIDLVKRIPETSKIHGAQARC